MGYIRGEGRSQGTLFPVVLDVLVPADHTRSKFLLVEGTLQHQDKMIHVKAMRPTELSNNALELTSHDFH